MDGVARGVARRTPCPIPGIVDEDNSSSGPASSTWSNWLGGWLVSQKPVVYSGPARLTIAASGEWPAIVLPAASHFLIRS
jgi:hypothetical protein